jgi:hypothetical protein
MKTLPALQIDFLPRRHATLSRSGLLVLAAGAVAAAWTVVDYLGLADRSAALEARLDAATPHPKRAGRSPTVDDGRGFEEATEAVRQLTLPWSLLLDELEAAGDTSKDIALLSIEPDHEKRRVRIEAEARTLPAAIAFTQHLQSANALAYPLLDNHKVKSDQSERPVHFEMTAEWRLPR